MQAVTETGANTIFANVQWEIDLVAAIVFVLVAGKLRGVGRGLHRGIIEFLDAISRLKDGMSNGASEAGRAAGGIYGKRAAQALTPDNQVAELYNPAVFGVQAPRRNLLKRLGRAFIQPWRSLCRKLSVFLRRVA